MAFDESDIRSAALCAWKEARGEGNDGMCAVLHVLNNRTAAPGFAKTLHDVIYGKNQFTSMSVPSDPEFNLEPGADDESFGAALKMATEMFAVNALPPGSIPSTDPTRGAHYYANLHEIDSDGWFYKDIVLESHFHPVTAQIGKHTFFV